MDNLERQTLEATLRRCRKQPCRPMSVSHADEQDAISRGFLRFHEWPSGHYEVTETGREFLSGVEYA